MSLSKISQNIFSQKTFSSKKFFIGFVFVFSFFVFVPQAHAAFPSFVPGTINSCGELTTGGTYTIGADFNANSTLDANHNCFVVSGAGTVTITGGASVKTITATGTATLAVEDRAYNTPGDISSGIQDAGSANANITIVNLNFVGFSGGINASGNDDNDSYNMGGSGKNVSLTNSSLGSRNIDVYGGSGSNTGVTGGSSGTVVLATSTVGAINAYGGDAADYNFFGVYSGNGGVVTLNNSVSGVIKTYSGNATGGMTAHSGTTGNVILNYSTSTTIYAYGGASPAASDGGSVTVSTSTTGAINAYGGECFMHNAGNGGTIRVTNSTTGNISTIGGLADYNNYGIDGGDGGSGGAVIITTSTTGGIQAYGSDSYGSGSDYGSGYAGSGGSVQITNSTTTSSGVDVHGGIGFFAGGYGGTINISGTNLNFSSQVFGTTKGLANVGASGTPGINGTLTITYSGTYAGNTNTYFNGASPLTVNGNNIGNWDGVAPLAPGSSLTSASQCNSLVFSGAYSLSGNLSGNCNIPYNGIAINGAGHTLAGNITGSNGTTTAGGGTAGVDINLSNIIVTGSTTAGTGGVGSGSGKAGGKGGAITIASSTISGALSTIGGAPGVGGSAIGGAGGAITISASNIGTTTTTGGNADVGSNGGAGGIISITASSTITGNILSSGGARLFSVGGAGGAISIASSTVTGSMSSNGASGGTSGAGGAIIISGSNMGSVNTSGGSGNSGGAGGTISVTSSNVGTVATISSGTDTGSAGVNGSSITIATSHTGNVSSVGGNPGTGGTYPGGNGGSINVNNSTTGTITSQAGGKSSVYGGGNGGVVSVTNSVTGNISSLGGAGAVSPGAGGSITISSAQTLALAGLTISTKGGTGATSTNGTLTLTYPDVITNNSTYFNYIKTLTINGSSYGAWNGVFNPLTYYFNNAIDTNWNTLGNWWNDAAYTVHASSTPLGFDPVVIGGAITTNTGAAASADSAVFNGTSSSAISLSVLRSVTFNGSSINSGTTTAAIVTFNGASTNAGKIISDLVTFFENLTGSTGGGIVATSTSSGIIQRIFDYSATTTRNFTNEGGRADWIVKAIGNIVVDIAGATYNLVNNVFNATLGAVFTSGANSAGQPTPTIVITAPTAGTNIKWAPNINWGNATSCMYSYDGFTSTTSVVCANNGSDIPRPTAGILKTLSLRGIHTVSGHPNISETSVTYTYDNTQPIYTSCGANDPLDEATRPYYYLADNVVGDCNVTVSTSLYGSATTTATSTSGGYTLTGQIIASATSTTNGFNITLRNITVTGTTTASGGSTGKNGGNIYVYNSTVGPLVTNGGINTGGNGGNAGLITVATSTTGFMIANGGNGSGNGGNGATTTVTTSLGNPLTSTITASGGSSTSCGNGGDSGIVNLTNSSYGTVTANAGAGSNGGCTSTTHTGGTQHAPIVIGVHPTQVPSTPSAPSSSGSVAKASGSGGGSSQVFVPGTINTVTLPVQNIKPLKIKALPTFGMDTKGSFSLITPLQNYLFTPLPKETASVFDAFSELGKYITGKLNINTTQSLVNLLKSPVKLGADAVSVPGIFNVVSPKGNSLVTTLRVDKKGKLSQYIRVKDYNILNLSLAIKAEKLVEGKLSNTKYTFANGKDSISTTITIPQKSGSYTFTTDASPLPLTIEVANGQTTSGSDTSTNDAPKLSWWEKIKSFFTK